MPLAIVVLALFFGAMKFDGFRPIGARALATLLPVGVVWAGVSKLGDAHPLLLRAAQVLGLAVIAAAELPVLRLLYQVDVAVPATTLRMILALLGAACIVLEGVAARRSLRARVSAWVCIALGFAAYLAGVSSGITSDRELGLVFVAGIVGLWGGGLAGLVLGGMAARLAKAPASAKA